VKQTARNIRKFINDNLARYKLYIEKKSKEAAEQAWRDQQIEEALSRVHLLRGDFREVLADMEPNSVDMIFTDPPYNGESIPLYEDLAKLGKKVLKPGGHLITYAGHHALPQIFQLMCPHLRYWWILSLKHGGASARLQHKKVLVEWKPLLWFVKEDRQDETYVLDWCQSTPSQKDLHEWQQSLTEATYYIKQLTSPDAFILDPCMGSGTTCLAAIQLGRQTWGSELQEDTWQTAKQHIEEYVIAEVEKSLNEFG
jgi:tRNA1(Val) A37 N6-methylase TrmN6